MAITVVDNRRKHAMSLILTLGLVVAAVLFQVWSLDGFQGWVFGLLFDEDTSYAVGYSDRGFRAVQRGMTEDQVQGLVGQPLSEGWSYEVTRPNGCAIVHFSSGHVVSWAFNDCVALGIRKGLPIVAAAVSLGAPPDVVYWNYSQSPSSTNYRERVVRLVQGRVVGRNGGWYFD
jgi:hypothetical protein